jgi:tellurite resistance protein TehA-like permease
MDVVLALATNLYLPFIIMSRHESQLSTMTAAWLLPIVATIVASGTGSLIAPLLPNAQHTLWTLLISYILWGCGVPLAMFTLVMYFHRLTMHALPPREMIVSVFLPLGPLGQGAFAVMNLGKGAIDILPRAGAVPLAPQAGQIAYVLGLLLGLVMWGFGLVWLFFALASISRSRFPFNLGWWGFTFPIGVYTVATTTLAKELPSRFFAVLGTGMSVAVCFLWVVVAAGTVLGAVRGELFFAPCLEGWRRSVEEKGRGMSVASERRDV